MISDWSLRVLVPKDLMCAVVWFDPPIKNCIVTTVLRIHCREARAVRRKWRKELLSAKKWQWHLSLHASVEDSQRLLSWLSVFPKYHGPQVSFKDDLCHLSTSTFFDWHWPCVREGMYNPSTQGGVLEKQVTFSSLRSCWEKLHWERHLTRSLSREAVL